MENRTHAPAWLTLSYSALVAVLIPIYWQQYNPQNFLWISDVGLFLTLFGLWFSSPLLMSIGAVGILPFEIIWDACFFGELFTGYSFIGIAHYMFDSTYSLFLRGLSLFHIFMQLIWIWSLYAWGYDKRAFKYASGLISTVLLSTYVLTDPSKGINGVSLPLFLGWTWMPPLVWLAIYMIILPLLIFWPAHRVLKKICKAA